jgi:hypothetical protein
LIHAAAGAALAAWAHVMLEWPIPMRFNRKTHVSRPGRSTRSYVTRRGGIGATRQRMYAMNVATASSTIVVMAELTSPRIT